MVALNVRKRALVVHQKFTKSKKTGFIIRKVMKMAPLFVQLCLKTMLQQ